jgi:hypothetical protein
MIGRIDILLRKGNILSSVLGHDPASAAGDTRLRCVVMDLIRSMPWIPGKLHVDI